MTSKKLGQWLREQDELEEWRKIAEEKDCPGCRKHGLEMRVVKVIVELRCLDCGHLEEYDLDPQNEASVRY